MSSEYRRTEMDLSINAYCPGSPISSRTCNVIQVEVRARSSGG
jgi:hypothetical protein